MSSKSALTPRPDEPWWTKEQVSAYYQIPVGTLRKWRRRAYGPQARLFGGALRWDPAEVRAFAADPANFPLPTS